MLSTMIEDVNSKHKQDDNNDDSTVAIIYELRPQKTHGGSTLSARPRLEFVRLIWK